MTQATRLLDYLRHHPGATPMQLITELRMPKYTARASDLRAMGYDVVVTRDKDGVTRYRVNEPAKPTTGEALSVWDVADAR